MGLREWLNQPWNNGLRGDVPVLVPATQVPADVRRLLRAGALTGGGFTSLGFLHVTKGRSQGYLEIWLDESRSVVGSVSGSGLPSGLAFSVATYQGSWEDPRGIVASNRPQSGLGGAVREGTHRICVPGASQSELIEAHRGLRAAHLVGPPLIFADLAGVKLVQDRILRQQA